MADVSFTSHKKECNEAVQAAVLKALRLVGGQAERYAKETISDMGAVDTGFLRNSITFAIDGESAEIGSYQDDAGTKTGEYSGTAPAEKDRNNRAVFIGTNVYYAPYIEYGTWKMAARPFLSQSIESHISDFQSLFAEAFKNLS